NHAKCGVTLESHEFTEANPSVLMERLTELLNASAVSTALGVASRCGLLGKLSTEPTSAKSLAEAAGLSQRYVEEILAVLVCGKIVILTQDQPLKYSVFSESRSALDGMGLYFEELPLLTRCAFDEVVDACSRGGGVDPGRYGSFGAWMGKLADEKHEKQLISKLLPLLEGGKVFEKLEQGARVLDLGCGEGTAPCLIAERFPKTEVFGLDAFQPSVDAAQQRAQQKELKNLHFFRGDASSFATSELGQFDLVTSFDVVHDLTRPQKTLQEVHKVLKAEGVFAMVDIKAESGVAENINHPMAPFLYAVSLMHCMPQGMNEDGPGLGMMWGRQTALSMLDAAGFKTEVLEMDFDTFNDCYLCRRA
ncbi:unnamed protein product, partial [Effrenium voratum]